MKMATEQSIYITYKAAWMIDQKMPEARKFAAVAKTWVSEAYKRVALIGHQIFGGTGYIVEHAMPIYSRRAKAGEYAFGSPNYQREIVAQELGL
jgi:alkylation response protein AidB-like acyl-CoA dehydrogenase